MAIGYHEKDQWSMVIYSTVIRPTGLHRAVKNNMYIPTED